MQLYEISPTSEYHVYVVARTAQEAGELLLTWNAASDHINGRFTVCLVSVDALPAEQRLLVSNAFAGGLVGVISFDPELGWTFSPPAWVPLEPDELRGAPIDRAPA